MGHRADQAKTIHTLLKIDFRNAFNEVKRSRFVKAASEMFPAMSSWTEWCYGEATV